MGYIGATVGAGGDTSFVLGFLPGFISQLLTDANNITGSHNATMEKIGSVGEAIFQVNFFPENWRIGFSMYLKDLNETTNSPVYGKILSYNFTINEMNALFNVITNATLLGVDGKPVHTSCKTNPTSNECTQSVGFLFLANTYVAVKSTNIKRAIENLFCQNITTGVCLPLTDGLITAITSYITNHLAKIVTYLAIDNNDYGIVTTKTQKQLANGWVMRKLIIPGKFPNGLPVPGTIRNDTNLVEAMRTQKYQEFYKCDLPSKKELTWAGMKETFL